MIIRFGIENYLSFWDRQEISFVATTLRGNKDPLLDSNSVPGGRLLPALMVYGPNASGKSNLVQAFQFLKNCVLYSHSRGAPSGGVPAHKFALAPADESRPTSVDIDFIINEVRYHYGFETDGTDFTAEWLHYFPNGRKSLLFDRSDGQNISFGRNLKGKNRIIADLMRSNSLFLSVAAQNDHDQLTEVHDKIKSISFDRHLSAGRSDVELQFKDGEIDPRTISFLEAIGTGIASYRKRDVPMPEEIRKLQEELFATIRKSGVFEGMKPPENPDKSQFVELGHRSMSGEIVFFSLDRESSGTRRLLLAMNSVFRALDEGSLLLIDEIDASLHTQVCEMVIKLFSEPKTNPHGAQLIATTHDTNLMRSSVIRRDQIWFCEKRETGASYVYPLTDIRTRQSDNIERGYLQGRYGAVPFSGSVLDLFERD